MKTIKRSPDSQLDENQKDKKMADHQDPLKQPNPNPDPYKTPKEPWKDPDPTTPEEGNKIYADKNPKKEADEDHNAESEGSKSSGPVTGSSNYTPGDKKAGADVENTGDPQSNETTEENRKQDPKRAEETKDKNENEEIRE